MKRLQNRIAESRFALITTSFLCAPIWMLAALVNIDNIVSVAVSATCISLATLLMAEVNNANSLIRIYSRMVSCIFLILMTITTYPYSSPGVALTALSVAWFYYCAFGCYQDTQRTALTFMAFTALGVCSLFFIQSLYFLPLLWCLYIVKLLAFSSRMFCASIYGILTPYWLLTPYILWKGDFNGIVTHFTALATYEQPLEFFFQWEPYQIVNTSLILLCAIIGIIHYLRTRQLDRIRTQLLYEFFIYVDFFAIVFLILQPQHYKYLLPIIIGNTAPLIGHFIALTETRWTNILTKLLLLLSIGVVMYNIFTHSNPLINGIHI